MAVYNASGTKVGTYTYDAYGNCTVNSTNEFVTTYNPIRYRGYYCDLETGFYYCNTRYYNPFWCRWISMDSTSYADIQSVDGLNLFAYCNNDPVNFVDPSGQFPILAVILGLTALTGLGLTIGGVVTDNNTLTAIGLTMVTIPALVSGGMAIVAGIGGATLTGIVGGVTVAAGLGSGMFASAEYQEAITGNNWMLDAGMSEGWYNGLLITAATIATLGTLASSFCYSFNIKSINGFGKYGKYGQQGKYYGMRFETGAGKMRVLSFHTHAHKVTHGIKRIFEWHWQLQKWNPIANETAGTIARWLWWSLTKL